MKLSLTPALLLVASLGACGDDAVGGDEEDCGVLLAGESLAQGEEIWSCDGRFNFIHQGDGNVVLYKGSDALFATGTDGESSSRLELRTDGNFVLTSTSGDVLFSTDTSGSGLRFVMQDDGNGVIYDESDNALWATGTNEGGGGEEESGCTADVDCGSCERCERSSGNCVSRLSC